jgi:ribosomal protein S18 acetylase RimI-like enzyme
MQYQVRLLTPQDVQLYKDLRFEALSKHPFEFRYAPEDEAALPLDAVRTLLQREKVLGVWQGEKAVGMLGFSRQQGVKLAHKGLLWGMYLKPEVRRSGLSKALLNAMLGIARQQVEILQLTVMAGNMPARQLYERQGFQVYATEKAAVKIGGFYFDELSLQLWLK